MVGYKLPTLTLIVKFTNKPSINDAVLNDLIDNIDSVLKDEFNCRTEVQQGRHSFYQYSIIGTKTEQYPFDLQRGIHVMERLYS